MICVNYFAIVLILPCISNDNFPLNRSLFYMTFPLKPDMLLLYSIHPLNNV